MSYYGNDDEWSKHLAGKTLTGLAVSQDGETTLRIDVTPGEHYYLTTEGDCCSESWWADILGAKSCYGAVIAGVRTLELPEPDDSDTRSRQEEDEVYGYALDTAKGVVTLVFRNSSNGYYGGWATGTTNDPVPTAAWERVEKNEWSA